MGGVVHVTAPFSIDNFGFYDVKNLVISYSVSNDSLYSLADDDIVIGDIPAGQVTSSSIDFQFDLISLFNRGIQWMVFHDDLLRFQIEVSCLYTMKLVTFEASYQAQIPWDALIRSYGVSDITYPSTLPAPGDPITISVDYWLHTSSRLAGLPNAVVTVSYYGDGTRLGQAQTTILLGQNYSGTVQIDVLPELHSEYSVVLELQVAGFTITRTVAAPSLSGVIP
ncbi:MAG: hypothetical protein A3K60_06560 [Euryarchaeota archaeon RBG_19FT_COMBO_56_21]|nr:MAG: hypothetical protein A3K60_06560 [Euryarchaeota archaeon RBG_19FT_COMBO_56_21]